MLNESALVRLLKPCSLRRGNGLTTMAFSGLAVRGGDYAAMRRPGETRLRPSPPRIDRAAGRDGDLPGATIRH